MTDGGTTSKRATLARNGAYGLLSWLLPALPSLIVTPVVLHRLGNERYGLYATILGITSYFFTLGIGRIAAKYVAEYCGSGDEARASELLSAALIETVIASVGALAVLIAATPYLVENILLIAPPFQQTAIEGVWIAGALILFTAVAQVWQSALQGLHRFDVFLWLSNAMSFLLSAGLLILVLTGGDVLSLLAWAVINALLTLILSIAAVKWVWPNVHVTLRIARDDRRAVTVYAMSVMGYQFFGVVVLLFERGWIVREFGMANVAYYLIPLNLSLLLLGFSGSALSALFPALNAQLSDEKMIADLYRRASKFVMIFAALAIVGGIASGRMFLRLWLGEDFAEVSWPLLVVDTITFSVVSLSLIWWQMAEAYRHAPVTAYTNLAMMLITIPLMIVLGRTAGLNGVAFGRLLGLLPYIALWVYVERRFAGGFAWSFWLDLTAKLAMPSVLSFIAIWGSLELLGTSWLSWVCGVVIGSLVYFAALPVVRAFDPTEIAMFKRLLFRKPADARL
jgi:O-antigen/teichoic acid export membrane protein